MLELYYFPASTCSLKVRLCLAEKNLDWVPHRMEARDGQHLQPRYLELNPNGVVPTLIHDGNVIIDSSVIIEYLDEVFPEIKLTPENPVERAHMRKWLRFFEEVPTPAVRFPSFNQALIKGFANLTEDEFEETADARPLRKHFYKRMGRDGFSDADINKAMDDMDNTLGRMEAALVDGPWLMGGQYTLADICVAPLIDRMEDLGTAYLWKDKYPHVTKWFARMKARPAYEQAYVKGSRLSDSYLIDRL